MINRSCETCRVKKLRCHGGEPCGPCRRSGSECVRVTRKKKTMKKKPAETAAATAGGAVRPTSIATLPSLGESSKTSIDSGDLQWLREARDAVGFSFEGCQFLLSLSFHYRVTPYLHGCVDADVLQVYLKRLFDATDNHVTGVSLTRDQVMLVLFALSGSLIFTPPNAYNAEPLKMAIAYSPRRAKHRLDPGACQRNMYKVAMRWLHACETPSLEAVQCIVAATMHDFEDPSERQELFDQAVRWALLLDLHQSPRDSVPSRAEEIRVRTWWFLVARSWLAAPKQWSYVLHPSLFTTRKPLNVELGDLEHGWDQATVVRNIHRFWTPAAYSMSLIALAETVRGLVDRRNERSRDSRNFQEDVVAAFDKLQASLPWTHATHTSISAEEAVNEHDGLSLAIALRIEKERWLLHQQLFHCFFALHSVVEPEIGAAEMIPSACTTLAHRMIDSLDKDVRHCSVLSASRLPIHTLTIAATVLAVDTINHGRHISGKHVDEFVRVAVAAGKARRLTNDSEPKLSPRRLLRLESLVEFWRENLPQDVVLEAVMKSTGALMEIDDTISTVRAQHGLQNQVQSAVESSYEQLRALHAPSTQLWSSNESWGKALRWDQDDASSVAFVDPRLEALQLPPQPYDSAGVSVATRSDRSTNPTPMDMHSTGAANKDTLAECTWQANYSASMVPGLAALLPAFQFDKDDVDWWSKMSLSLQGDDTATASAV